MWKQLFIMSFITVMIAIDYSASTELRQGGTKLSDCKCAHFDCGCCSHIKIDFAEINGTLCIDMSYLPTDIGVSLSVTYNNETIFNETISVRNPPPICPILIKELDIEACIRFYDMEFDRHHFSGCAEADIKFLKAVPLMKKDLGCFHMGIQNSSINSIPYTVTLVR